jgi:hypothetical protein
MVTEERKQEIIENRRTFQRLNREIVEGKRRKETITVTGRDGTQYDLEIHALSELAIARAAHVANLSLQDLLKKTDAVTDEKGLAKLQFLDEIVSAALVGDESERLTADELAEILPGSERARLFKRILEISGLTQKAKEDVEKFQPQPSGRPTGDASV